MNKIKGLPKYTVSDLESILTKISENQGLNIKKSTELFHEVLKFLFLVNKHEKTLTPSILVDNAWHEFILHTNSYHNFCSKYMNRFIHHTPDSNKAKNMSQFRETLNLYFREFQSHPPPEFWEVDLKSDCGSCESH